MLFHAMRVHDSGMGIEDVAGSVAGLHDLFDRSEGLARRLLHPEVMSSGLADDECAHEGGVIMAVDASEFECELVVLRQLAPARFVAAQEGVRTGTDDEFIAGI